MSARIAPSRRLRAGLLLFALAQLCAAILVGLVFPDRVSGAPFCAAFFLLAALSLLHRWAGPTKAHRIDVSETGTIRLTVQQEVEAEPPASDGSVVTLLPASLVWPSMLLLHLADEAGTRHLVPVLRDSLQPSDFRALRVAIGTLGRHSRQAATPSEIL